MVAAAIRQAFLQPDADAAHQNLAPCRRPTARTMAQTRRPDGRLRAGRKAPRSPEQYGAENYSRRGFYAVVIAVPVALFGSHTLVPLEHGPADITFVLILEQHIPFRLRAPQTALDALAAVLDAHLAHRAAKGVGAGIIRKLAQATNSELNSTPDSSPKSATTEGECRRPSWSPPKIVHANRDGCRHSPQRRSGAEAVN
jgi:hypothetical protein